MTFKLLPQHIASLTDCAVVIASATDEQIAAARAEYREFMDAYHARKLRERVCGNKKTHTARQRTAKSAKVSVTA